MASLDFNCLSCEKTSSVNLDNVAVVTYRHSYDSSASNAGPHTIADHFTACHCPSCGSRTMAHLDSTHDIQKIHMQGLPVIECATVRPLNAYSFWISFRSPDDPSRKRGMPATLTMSELVRDDKLWEEIDRRLPEPARRTPFCIPSEKAFNGESAFEHRRRPYVHHRGLSLVQS